MFWLFCIFAAINIRMAAVARFIQNQNQSNAFSFIRIILCRWSSSIHRTNNASNVYRLFFAFTTRFSHFFFIGDNSGCCWVFLSLRAYFKQSVENAQINSRLAILWLHHNNKFSGSRTFAKQQGKKLKLKNNNNNKSTSIPYVVCDAFMTYYLGLVTVEMRCTVFNCRYDIVHKVSQLNYSSERIRLKYVPMQSKCIVEQCNNNTIHEIYQLTKVQRSNDVIINIHLLFFRAHFTPEPW